MSRKVANSGCIEYCLPRQECFVYGWSIYIEDIFLSRGLLKKTTEGTIAWGTPYRHCRVKGMLSGRIGIGAFGSADLFRLTYCPF
jgi:hypothetical protein